MPSYDEHGNIISNPALHILESMPLARPQPLARSRPRRCPCLNTGLVSDALGITTCHCPAGQKLRTPK